MSSISKAVPAAATVDLGLHRLQDGLRHLVRLVVREYRIRHAISLLHRLDDRSLADMGIVRSQISRTVRAARREAERRRGTVI